LDLKSLEYRVQALDLSADGENGWWSRSVWHFSGAVNVLCSHHGVLFVSALGL
jgi:hypothetical protein